MPEPVLVGDEIEYEVLDEITIYPNKLFATPQNVIIQAIKYIFASIFLLTIYSCKLNKNVVDTNNTNTNNTKNNSNSIKWVLL